MRRWTPPAPDSVAEAAHREKVVAMVERVASMVNMTADEWRSMHMVEAGSKAEEVRAWKSMDRISKSFGMMGLGLQDPDAPGVSWRWGRKGIPRDGE